MPHFDYAGLITQWGKFRGCVYFSAPRQLIRLQEPDTSEDNLLDVVGEVANTISGNVRDISVPITIRSVLDRYQIGDPRPW